MTKPKKALLEISKLLDEALTDLAEIEKNEPIGNRKSTITEYLNKLNSLKNNIDYLEDDWDDW